MLIPRFSPNRVRPNENPELVSSRNFEGLGRITDALARRLQAESDRITEIGKRLKKFRVTLAAPDRFPYGFKYSLDYTDFNASGAVFQANVALLTLPAGVKCSSLLLYPSSAWSGGAITDVTLSVGALSGGVYNASYLDPFSTSIPFGHNPVAFVPSMTGDTILYVQAISDGDTLNALTGGAVDIYLELSQFANY